MSEFVRFNSKEPKFYEDMRYSMTEFDCLPFTDLQMDPSCWEEVERNGGARVFFVLAGYRGTPSITIINHREKRKICFDKTQFYPKAIDLETRTNRIIRRGSSSVQFRTIQIRRYSLRQRW